MAKKKAKTDFKKGRLSNDDFTIFKDNIHMSDEDLSIKLNRTVSFIEKTRQRVFPNKKTGKWSKHDLEVLTENQNQMSFEELARLLNRDEKSIKTKIKSLKPKEAIKKGISEVIEKYKEDIVFNDEKGEVYADSKIIDPVSNDIWIPSGEVVEADYEEGENFIKGDDDLPIWKAENDPECCGENCCDHENKVTENSVKLPWWKRFFNIFKVW